MGSGKQIGAINGVKNRTSGREEGWINFLEFSDGFLEGMKPKSESKDLNAFPINIVQGVLCAEI
jgi:hypothetical protein